MNLILARLRTAFDDLGNAPWLLVLVLSGLAVLGTAMQVSTNASNLAEGEMAARHAIRFGAALAMLFVLALVPLRLWSWAAWPAYIVSLLLLVGVELFGSTAGGAQRWLDVGPIRVQPSEFMKIALILALARYYHGMSVEQTSRLLSHVPALLIIAAPTALVFHQPDLGTSLMLASSGLAVIFFAGLPWRVIIVALVMMTAAIPVAYQFVLKDYQRERVLTFLSPERDPLGAGYHIQQAKIAIGSGGLYGKGYLEGSQSQLDYIPEQHTDFIFTVIAEELGFVGSMGLLLGFAASLFLSLMIASRCRSNFGRLAAGGAVVTIAFYVLVNLAMVMGLLPVVGVPLPLISYGGTAMLTVMAGFGLIASVHLHARERI
jgi:rod shape determining protein RodA